MAGESARRGMWTRVDLQRLHDDPVKGPRHDPPALTSVSEATNSRMSRRVAGRGNRTPAGGGLPDDLRLRGVDAAEGHTIRTREPTATPPVSSSPGAPRALQVDCLMLFQRGGALPGGPRSLGGSGSRLKETTWKRMPT